MRSGSISSPSCWRYLAGAQHSRHAVAVPQRELDLDVDSPRSLTRDPHRPQPVVLARAHHIAHLNEKETCVSGHQASCEVLSRKELPNFVVNVPKVRKFIAAILETNETKQKKKKGLTITFHVLSRVVSLMH